MRRRQAGRPRSAPPGRATPTLPTLAFGNYLDARRRTARPTRPARDNELVRPDATGPRYAPPIALSPGYCTLSMLFSDWDRSGRRDLRVSNDRHYYASTARSSCGGSRPASRRALYTADDGWVQLQIWGMGIASQDLTGDGLPGGLPHQPGRQQAPDPARRARPARRTATSPSARGVDGARQPYTGGDAAAVDRLAPGVRRTSTTTASWTCSCPRATSTRCPTTRRRDPSNLLLGQPDGTFVEGAEAAGIVAFDRGRGAALVDLNLDGLLDLVAGQPRRAGPRLAERRRRHGRRARRDGPLARRPARAAGRQPRRDRRGGRGPRPATRSSSAARLIVGGGHAGGQLGLDPRRPRAGDGRREVRVTWPDGEVGPWQTIAADRFVRHRARRGRSRSRGRRPGAERMRG